MRNALLGMLVLLTVACGAYHFPGDGQPGTGTVSGKVVAVPCAPVEQAGSPCTGRPASNLQLDFTAGGKTVSAVTDSNGAYSIELPAGTYKVTVKAPMRIIDGPASMQVQAGATVVANFVLDSGIRVPVPQQ